MARNVRTEAVGIRGVRSALFSMRIISASSTVAEEILMRSMPMRIVSLL